MRKNPLLSQFASVPALLAPDMQDRFETCIASAWSEMQRFEERQHATVADAPVMQDDFWYAESDWRSYYRPYAVVDGVLQIPVKGVLLNQFPYAFGWATGYEYIWRAYERGMGDLNVKGIALIVDSPGGLVAGNFELVDKMFALRGTKPVSAFVADFAYSAAYSIASVVDPGRLHVTKLGGVGSIGVLTMHVDYSKMMDEAGVKVTFIYAGAHKVDGNAYEALPPKVKARIQERIDAIYDVFVAAVARNRDLEEQAVRDTEALTFMASEAVQNGLADKIGVFEDSLADFAAELSEGSEEMSTTDNSAVDQAAIDTARAEGVAHGRTEGATAERGRITAILGSDEGKARPVAALAAALETDMSVDQAKAFLGKIAEEKPAASTDEGEKPNGFEQAMDKSKNPELGAGDDGENEMAVSDRILANAGYGKPERAARH